MSYFQIVFDLDLQTNKVKMKKINKNKYYNDNNQSMCKNRIFYTYPDKYYSIIRQTFKLFFKNK